MLTLAERIDRDFTYHAPTDEQVERYNALRAQTRELAHTFRRLCPESRELSLALTHLQTAVMFANASIAVNEVK